MRHGVSAWRCLASIETEHEFVQVVLEVDPPQTVVNAQAPALEV
jgi:hypothetical protein